MLIQPIDVLILPLSHINFTTSDDNFIIISKNALLMRNTKNTCSLNNGMKNGMLKLLRTYKLCTFILLVSAVLPALFIHIL